MDTELFMECEEEELEPWQQVDDSVEEDEMDYMDNYGEPVEDSPPPQNSETPPPRPPSITPSAPALCLVSSVTLPTPPPIVTSSLPPVACLPTSSNPAVSAPPLVTQGPPLILTQTAAGTFLLPAHPRSGGAQPILLTAQGFPVQTVVNPGAPLLLNLQPGQTVQPLTLIQSSSLGQLVRPRVGLSPVRPQGQNVLTRTSPTPSGGLTQPGSTFTAMQLPATLTFHTSTPRPINFQMTQLVGANAMKLPGSPTLPPSSASGVTTLTVIGSTTSRPVISTASRPSPLLVTPPTKPSAPSADPHRVVMSVEEFYYGTFEGDLSLRKPQPLGIQTSTFTCQICTHLAENNLRLMQHMLQHSELIGIGAGDDRKCCRFCYRQFSSPAQLHSHQEQVHGSAPSSSMCRICEWAFESEPTFLNHMKSCHKPGEMPYVCQVCSYRSSFYSDVLQHFASFHRDSRFLLCLFCLKVTRNPVSYQQHLLRHQMDQAFHCNRCRLQFVVLKDKTQHKMENHRSFRRPAQLDGLPAGSKVTIRSYGKFRPPITSAGGRPFQSPSSLVQPIYIKTEPQRSPIHRSPIKRLVPCRVHRTPSRGSDRLLCLECGTDASDLSAHYPTHVHCLLCPYSSCCSRAYAAHMIHHHVPRSKDKVLLHRLPPPCPFLLQCSQCSFRPHNADQMADHLLRNPEHHSATCRSRTHVEADIQFCPEEKQCCPEEEDPPPLACRSAAVWKQPAESSSNDPPVEPFQQSSGPRHSLTKTSDAIDFFNLLFPAALVELITRETNAHVKTCRFLGSFDPEWVPVTTHEVKGFLGLVILMGIQNLPDPAHYWSWSHYDNSYTFYRAMSFKRFKQIAANIRMGSFAVDEHRGTNNSSDALHIFRPMLDILGGAMWDAYQPNCSLTIDRALLPGLEEESCRAKGQPRTQPQVWLLCDSKSGYCHRFFIQVGEKAGQEPGFTVVPGLVQGLEDRHHQLYLASCLTSVPLMQKLLQQGLYASSSFPPPSPILPRELWEEGELEKPGDFLQKQCGPLLATRWRDTKEMGCLSTNASLGKPDTVWRRSQSRVGGLDPISRPMAFRLLQENMRGVDICKQLLACNPLGGIPQDLHWRGLFWFLINLSIVNAFIVLRESRKDSPPAWVQDGLFTQVNFRKRLGNQLAKCAQKYCESVEMAGSRVTRMEAAEVVVKQRHRMVKISAVSKRCKNCNLKNIRHESVYGCSICKANLCKHPGCFWEYHGLSPLNKGSTKVGFLKDRSSGAVEVDEVEDTVDAAMAPVEDMDFSEDDTVEEFDDLDEEPDDIKEVKHPVCDSPSTTSCHAHGPAKEREDVLTARQLRVALFALCDGLHQASRVFSTEPTLIQSWLKEAKKRLKRCGQEKTVHSDSGGSLVAWVLSMREQQLPITESSLFHKVSTLKKKGGFSDSFRISYDWAVSFMLQHQLGTTSSGTAATLARTLPSSLEDKVTSFRKFTQRIIRLHQLSASTVAAMDELCLFMDFRLVPDKRRRSEALELIGSVPLVTVYLAALADGTMLPALVLANRQLDEKVVPEFILLQAGRESLSVEEALDLWTNRVWHQHVCGRTQPSRSVLVLDRHRDHLGDRFLSALSGSGTLPAVIPGGCSFSLQPLDMCVRPVLQRLLLTRWARFTARSPQELEETSPQQLQANVAQLLVDWTVEALVHLNTLSQLWEDSFRLTGLLPKDEDGQERGTERLMPEEVQLGLFKVLTETLMGPESDLLELEDEEFSTEEPETAEEKDKEGKEDRNTKEDTRKHKEMEEDSEEEGKEREEDQKEVNKERRETRIVIGEEVGNEWKIKSRTEGDTEDTMDKS